MCEPLGHSSGDAFNDTLRDQRPRTNFEIRGAQEDTVLQAREHVRTPFGSCRGVPLNGGEASEGVAKGGVGNLGGVQGGRGEGGKVNLPPIQVVNPYTLTRMPPTQCILSGGIRSAT